MKETLFYLQAGKINEAAYRLIDYGPLGIYAFITTAGFIVLVLFIRKKYERHLNEKNKEIQDLKEEIRQLRDEVRSLTRDALKRITDAMDHNSDVISENSKAHYEHAAIV